MPSVSCRPPSSAVLRPRCDRRLPVATGGLRRRRPPGDGARPSRRRIGRRRPSGRGRARAHGPARPSWRPGRATRCDRATARGCDAAGKARGGSARAGRRALLVDGGHGRDARRLRGCALPWAEIGPTGSAALPRRRLSPMATGGRGTIVARRGPRTPCANSSSTAPALRTTATATSSPRSATTTRARWRRRVSSSFRRKSAVSTR